MDTDARDDSLFSITRGASFFAVGRVTYNGLAFLFHFLLVQSVGPVAYGVYSLATTVAMAATVFTNLGSDKSILRYFPRYHDDPVRQDRVLTLSLLTSAAGGLVLSTVIFVFAPRISALTIDEPLLVPTLRIFMALLFFRTMTKIVGNAFRAADRPAYDVLLRSIVWSAVRVLAVGSAVVLALSPFDTFLAIVVGAGVTTTLGFYLLFTRTDFRPRFGYERGELREYYSYSVPLTFKDFGSFLYTRVDVLMVGLFFSSAVVGVYNLSLFVSAFVVLPLAAINKMFPPMASKLESNDQWGELRSVYATVTRWSVTAALPLAIGGVVYAAEILELFDPSYTPWALVFTLFVTAQFFNTAVGPSGFLLMMTDHQYLITLNQWTFGILNVVLNYVFITYYGTIGAAAATSLVLASLNVVRVVEVWWFEGMVPYTRSFAKPLVAGAGAATAMIASHVVLSGTVLLFVGGGFGVAVYGLLLIGFGVDSQDRQLVDRWRNERAAGSASD